MSGGLEAHFERVEQMRRQRIVTFSESLNRWCVCNGCARILATAATREEAEALAKQQLYAEQLRLF
jgi:hypothetical protein